LPWDDQRSPLIGLSPVPLLDRRHVSLGLDLEYARQDRIAARYRTQLEDLVRIALLDDAGVDIREPRFIVAGVILAPDRHTALVVDRLFPLARKIRPDKPNVVLHASDLWHGAKEFTRDKCPQLRRQEIVREIAAIPGEFGLPVVFGQCTKAGIPKIKPETKADREIAEAAPHISAQWECSMWIEHWMRAHAPDEIAHLVHEDHSRSKKSLKWFHNIARDPQLGSAIFPGLLSTSPTLSKILPFRKIKGPIYYADKYEERLLQVADTCAFVISRHLAGHPDISDVFAVLEPQIWRRD
jgi:hypothetical protein